MKLRQERRVATVLISHNLQHVFAITDRIVVLRHGQIAGNVKTSETTPDEVVSLITGASLVDRMHSEGGIER